MAECRGTELSPSPLPDDPAVSGVGVGQKGVSVGVWRAPSPREPGAPASHSGKACASFGRPVALDLHVDQIPMDATHNRQRCANGRPALSGPGRACTCACQQHSPHGARDMHTEQRARTSTSTSTSHWQHCTAPRTCVGVVRRRTNHDKWHTMGRESNHTGSQQTYALWACAKLRTVLVMVPSIDMTTRWLATIAADISMTAGGRSSQVAGRTHTTPM